jgi:plasmid stabilization system protein ParE
MANKSIRFHPEAEKEYLAALSWYRQHSFIAASDFESAVGRAVEVIGRTPKRWPVCYRDFRKYTLHQFPFSIVYRELPSEVIVVAIAHGRRRPAYWKDRK